VPCPLSPPRTTPASIISRILHDFTAVPDRRWWTECANVCLWQVWSGRLIICHHSSQQLITSSSTPLTRVVCQHLTPRSLSSTYSHQSPQQRQDLQPRCIRLGSATSQHLVLWLDIYTWPQVYKCLLSLIMKW